MRNHSVEQLLEHKRLVGYGAGMSLLQCQAAAPLALNYAVDDTPGFAGNSICGVPICSSEKLREERQENLLVIIYADSPRAIFTISARLNRMGLEFGTHFIDCGLLHFGSIRNKLMDHFAIEPSYDRFFRIRMQRLSMAIESLSYIAGTWIVCELLDRCCGSVPGDIAECGVYKGGNALLTLLNSDIAAQRSYHLFDSFAGFPLLSEYDPVVRQHDFQDVDFGFLAGFFRNFENVIIQRGFFTETVPTLDDRSFCMVYVDCDLYEPTVYLIEQFYKRLAPGGFMVFHDYWFPQENPLQKDKQPFQGVYKAVHELLGSEAERVVVFPETTHGVLRKI